MTLTTPTKKIIHDFWQERTRTVLVVIAIALGVAAFLAVMASYAILTRELDRGYLATNPASAIFRLDSIDDELVRAVLSDPSVSDAEPRRVVSGQMRVGPIQWRNMVLFVVKDYRDVRVSKLEHEAGAWPPGKGEILIERDAFQVAKAKIGDVVTVKTANGSEQKLTVTGSVHDVGQAQARMENIVYGYITLDTLTQLGEEPVLDRLNILVANNRFDEDHVQSVTNNIQKLIEARGHKVLHVEIPKPGKHPHSDLTGILLLAMSTFGLFVLILSGILVVNLLTAMMASQVRQIGMMKAIGATRWQLVKIYLGQAILFGLGATIIAIPLGIIGSRLLCDYMAMFLNFDIYSYSIPVWVFVLAIVVGIVTPLVSAAWPVWKGTRISVRAALADYGVSQGRFGASWIDSQLARVGGVSRPILMSLRNSFRRRARLALTLLTLTAGGLFFMSALNIRSSLINTLDRLFEGRKFDLNIGFASPQPREKLERAIKNTQGVKDFELWFITDASLDDDQPKTGGEPQASGGMHGGASATNQDRFTVIALPAGSRMQVHEIVEGRDFEVGESNAIVLNSTLAARNPQIKVGSTINLQMGPANTTWKVVGIARESYSPRIAYIPMSFIEERHPGVANNIRLALNSPDWDSIDIVKSALDQNLEREGLRARSSSSKTDSRYGFDQHMLMIYIFLIITSVIVGGVGGLGLMTTMSVNVLERRREMGVLRAIGATSRMIGLIVVAEGLSIGILSWLLAALTAWPVSRLLGDVLVKAIFRGGMDFIFEPVGLIIWLGVSIFLSGVATLLPAWRASKSTVREALAYQ